MNTKVEITISDPEGKRTGVFQATLTLENTLMRVLTNLPPNTKVLDVKNVPSTVIGSDSLGYPRGPVKVTSNGLEFDSKYAIGSTYNTL